MLKVPYIPRNYDKWAKKNWKRFCKDFKIVDYKEYSLRNRDDEHMLFDHPLSFITKDGDGIIVTQPFMSRDDILNYIKRDAWLVQDCIDRDCTIHIFENCQYNWRATETFVIFILPKNITTDKEIRENKKNVDVTIWFKGGFKHTFRV